MRLVIVTGMSGSGKQTAMKLLEDAGYYCVDNLPVPLVPTFAELIVQPGSEIEKAAVGLDIRSDQAFGDIMRALSQLTERGIAYEVLFMDADDSTLLKRYKESRRMHPIDGNGAIEESILKERSILKEIRDKADYVIDTSSLLTRELKEELDRIFVRNEAYNSLMITIMSFGFKNGIPLDADLVFDVRFLPNPFYIDELKKKTGNDKEVYDYVMSFAEAGLFLDKLTDMLAFLIPNYVKEGKYRLVIGIGCTGGKHRSVTLANALYKRMKDHGNYGLTLVHKDVDRLK
ncbi:RNase adapter RapZ [Kineothrix sp. MSJ-39]|uniref:RNase adapter RapZ n=1 Tax=Kineothrix sp. MSJ-39 TaxID=2841533 RepID=UPI001C10EE9E|nr:RNase adapter RapZ [Kineothrix sp. MSJ-39]MBU5428809.1 RNase adapter RapZ [Kineothrix sp. MSJ-39]